MSAILMNSLWKCNWNDELKLWKGHIIYLRGKLRWSLKILFSSSTNNRQNDCMIRMNTEVSMKIKIHDFKNVKMWAVSKAVQIMKLKCSFLKTFDLALKENETKTLYMEMIFVQHDKNNKRFKNLLTASWIDRFLLANLFLQF